MHRLQLVLSLGGCLMCNHKIRINLMRCLRNSTARREIGQLVMSNVVKTSC